MRDWFQNFMIGRYGLDSMGRTMNIITLVLLVLSLLFGQSILTTIALVLLLITYYRMFSRNHAARARENQKYLEFEERARDFARRIAEKTPLGRGRADRTSANLVFSCPRCSQKIRVPKGHGTIEITCPKCRNVFRRRS